MTSMLGHPCIHDFLRSRNMKNDTSIVMANNTIASDAP
jgi:hypothetical protein